MASYNTRLVAIAAVTLAPLRGQDAPTKQPELIKQRRYTGENSKTPIAHVATALLGKDSLVYVLDSDSKVIHVANGSEQVRLISRAGRGPGELQHVYLMSFLGDSLVVPDGSLARVTLFPLRGKSARTVSVPSASATGFYGANVVAYGRSAMVLTGSNLSGQPENDRTNNVALFLRRHGSTKLDTLAHLIRPNIWMDIPVMLRGEKANMLQEQPFLITPTWDVAREGGGVVVLDTAGHTATSVTLRLRQWSNEGPLIRTCTIARTLRPLTNAAYEAGLANLGPPPSAREIVKPDWAAMRRAVIRPATLPPFRSVRLASDGTVWVRTDASFASNQEEYLVFAPTGCGAPRTVLLPLAWKLEDARGRLFIASGYVDDAPAVDTWRY